MFSSLEALADLCLSPTSPWSGATAPTILLVAGLVGGVAHCAPMCGAFVLGQVGDRMARLPAARLCELQRVRSAALLPYHLGRITTYATLGAIAASVGGWLGDLPWLGHLRPILLFLGAFAFFAAAAAGLGLAGGFPGLFFPVSVNRMLMRVASAARAYGGFPLGLALGLIPCGMIYAALAVAAAARDPIAGAVAMAAFGVGTAPSLIAVGLAGHAAGMRLNRVVKVATPFLLMISGTFLSALAIASL